MDQKERTKLIELIRNNPELPVRALVECNHSTFPLTGDVYGCKIREYGRTKTGKYIMRCPKAEEMLPDIEWKPAISLMWMWCSDEKEE